MTFSARPKEQTIGLNYKSWTDSVNRQIAYEAYAKVFKMDISCRFSYEIIREDGVRRVVEDSGSPIRNAQGDIVGL